MENLPENPFGLSKMKQNLKKTDHSHKILGVYLGLAVIVLFLGLASLAPQISKRFGNIAEKKESQKSFAGLTPPCSSSAGGYGDVDGDGSVTGTDATLIGRYIVGLSTSIPFTDNVKKRADVNGNLRVDGLDQTMILNYVTSVYLTFPMCVDQDEDGYVNGVENYLGTDPYKACATSSSDVDATKPGKPSKVWPADLFTATGVPATYNKITIQDLTTFLAPTRRLDSSPGDTGYDKRWDLVPGAGIFGKDINISDLTNLNTVAPPMFGGQRAMTGPVCVSKLTPTVNLTASSASVVAGGSITLSWTSNNAVFPCSASGDWSGQKQLNSGTNPYRVSLSVGTFNYTLTCYGSGGERSDTETVIVTPPSACPSIIVPRNLYRNPAGTIFVITDDCQKRGIVSLDAFNSCLYDGNAVIQATDADLNSVTNGSVTEGSPDCPPAPTVTLPPPVVNEPRGWPVAGTIGDLGIHYTGEYSDAAAVDILVAGGTPIYSTMSGVTTVLPWDSSCGYGLDITSSTGFLIHFCHLHNNLSGSDIVVRTGDNVTQGNHIGYIGFSNEMGEATTPQTHYAIQAPTSAPGAIPGEMQPDYVPQTPYAGLQVTR